MTTEAPLGVVLVGESRCLLGLSTIEIERLDQLLVVWVLVGIHSIDKSINVVDIELLCGLDGIHIKVGDLFQRRGLTRLIAICSDMGEPPYAHEM